jgi:hypothetical protein
MVFHDPLFYCAALVTAQVYTFVENANKVCNFLQNNLQVNSLRSTCSLCSSLVPDPSSHLNSSVCKMLDKSNNRDGRSPHAPMRRPLNKYAFATAMLSSATPFFLGYGEPAL